MKEEAEAKPGRPSKGWLFAIVWMVGVTLLSLFRPDFAFALVVWPAWVILLPGLIPIAFKGQPRVMIGVVWMACLLINSEEPYSMIRALVPHERGQLRIVSLNCAGGSLDAAREVIPLKPDIVLLQESPSRPDLEKLSAELFGEGGSLVWGPDASVLARGQLNPKELPRGTSNFVTAEWSDGGDRKLLVTSLRLQPPVLRLDVYNPDSWKSFADNRVARRDELNEILEALKSGSPDIVGGDFNTPPERGYVKGMSDSFAEQGRGYGATCVNPIPCLVRIDQIWRSTRLRTVNSFVVKTTHSDHRIAVSDFAWNAN